MAGRIFDIGVHPCPSVLSSAISAALGGEHFSTGRIRTQLNNHRLMRHIEQAKSGKRMVLVGEVITRPGQQVPKVLSILERTYIRHFLAERHDLVNQQGTKIRRHEIESSGGVPRRFIPSSMFVER